MFKKNDIPIEEVLKDVAQKNKLEYVPQNQRRKNQNTTVTVDAVPQQMRNHHLSLNDIKLPYILSYTNVNDSCYTGTNGSKAKTSAKAKDYTVPPHFVGRKHHKKACDIKTSKKGNKS